MEHECGACDGSGECNNEHHNFFNQVTGGTVEVLTGVDDPCPACGGGPGDPGKCSVCGGSGEQDDED